MRKYNNLSQALEGMGITLCNLHICNLHIHISESDQFGHNEMSPWIPNFDTIRKS